MNKKVMAMFEKAEDEYNALISKKNIIEVSFGGSVQLILTALLTCMYINCGVLFFIFHRRTNPK